MLAKSHVYTSPPPLTPPPDSPPPVSTVVVCVWGVVSFQGSVKGVAVPRP